MNFYETFKEVTKSLEAFVADAREKKAYANSIHNFLMKVESAYEYPYLATNETCECEKYPYLCAKYIQLKMVIDGGLHKFTSTTSNDKIEKGVWQTNCPLAFINESTKDPFFQNRTSDAPNERENVSFFNAFIFGYPIAVYYTTKEVSEGGMLYTNYGKDYWDRQKGEYWDKSLKEYENIVNQKYLFAKHHAERMLNEIADKISNYENTKTNLQQFFSDKQYDNIRKEIEGIINYIFEKATLDQAMIDQINFYHAVASNEKDTSNVEMIENCNKRRRVANMIAEKVLRA